MELILGALSIVIFALVACIVWACCHPKKGQHARDTQIIDEPSEVRDLVANDDENIDFAPVGKAFVDKVTGKRKP